MSKRKHNNDDNDDDDDDVRFQHRQMFLAQLHEDELHKQLVNLRRNLELTYSKKDKQEIAREIRQLEEEVARRLQPDQLQKRLESLEKTLDYPHYTTRQEIEKKIKLVEDELAKQLLLQRLAHLKTRQYTGKVFIKH